MYRAVRAAVFGVGGAPLDFARHRVGFLVDFPGARPFGLRGLEGRLVLLSALFLAVLPSRRLAIPSC